MRWKSTSLIAAWLLVASPGSAQLIAGTIVDERSGEAIVAVLVEVVVGDSTLAAGLTNAGGRFTLAVPERAPYTLRVSAFGYSDLSLDILPDGSTLGPFTIRLAPNVIELEGVAANVEAVVRPAEWTGFARRDSIGRGEFYLKSDLQRYPAARSFQLLRQVPLLRTTPSGGVTIGGRCRPDVFIDGSLARGLSIPEDPDLIIAIEVYQATSIIPPRWRRAHDPRQCGALVIWTTVAGG